MSDITKFAKQILDDVQTQEPSGTSIPRQQIDSAIELANVIRDKVDNLLSEVDLALQDLNEESSPNILESKDDFKSLVLRLKQIKKKIMVI